MRSQSTLLAAAVSLLFSALVSVAQAPAGAPAGSNGVCNDGTYSTDAKKPGACRGHKGVKTWFAAATAAPNAPAAAQPATPASRPTPTAAAAPAAKPAAAAPAAAPAPTSRRGPGGAASARTQAAGGGPGIVWVNTESKVYHCSGTQFYGKTKQGKYMSEADAKAAGAHADHNKPCGN